MRKILFILLASLFVLEVQAQKIHWLLFFDTADQNVGRYVANGRNIFNHYFVDVVNSALNDAGIRSVVHDINGSNLSPQNLKRTIESFSCGSNDIVFFYYIGHGGRSFITDDYEHPWPKLWCGQSDATKMIDLEWIHNTLKQKRPRLLFTVGECCNVYQFIPPSLTPQLSNNQETTSLSVASRDVEVIKSMFMKPCGDFIATSASPSEAAKCGRIDGLGDIDYYTAALVEAFMAVVGEQTDTKFETLFGGIAKMFGDNQHPIFKSNLKYNCSPISANEDDYDYQEITTNTELLEKVQLLLDYVHKTGNNTMNGLDMVFSDKCIVKIVGRDGVTVVDKKGIKDYLLFVATSRSMLKSVPIKVVFGSDAKISEIYVREYYKGR